MASEDREYEEKSGDEKSPIFEDKLTPEQIRFNEHYDEYLDPILDWDGPSPLGKALHELAQRMRTPKKPPEPTNTEE